MADDGMLLNFSFGETTLPQKQKLKGGSWRARRAAQKYAANGSKGRRLFQQLPLKCPENQNSNDEDFEPSYPKRRKLDATPAFKPQTNAPRQPRDKQEKQVISSLFTYNPASKPQGKPAENVAPEQAVEASNAPLTGNLENFTSLGLTTTLAAHLTNKLGIKKPTVIQKAAIGQLLQSDSDAFVQAETGSGKTLAYLLPIVQRIMELSRPARETSNNADKVHRDSGLFAIVLTPTRELARQIATVLDSLLRCAHWIVSGIVIGGEKKKSEKARLRKGLNILIATPGRLADHLSHTEALDVGSVRWLVLDEGDRLVELGFEDDIKKIVGCLNTRQKDAAGLRKGLPERRSTVLCSATMKMDVQRLGEISLKDARHIQAHTNEERDQNLKEKEFTAPAQLKQSYAIVPAKLRLVTLRGLLKQSFARKGAVNKAIVFISCADSVDFHFQVFARQLDSASTAGDESRSLESTVTSAPSPHLSTPDSAVHIFRLHGSLAQHLRTSTLQAFHRSTDPAILFCTDVASRGLDLPNVDLVVEYDPAFSRDEHLHRIGRTARAGNAGRAVVFLMPGAEEEYVDILAKDRPDALGGGAKRVEAEDVLRKSFATSVSQSTNWDEEATTWQLDVERWALASPTEMERARKAYISHVRAYATHVVGERKYFDIKELHLGHLAKAFGLRDRPGNMNLPAGTQKRSSGGNRAKEGNAKVGRRSDSARDDEKTDESQEAARKMRKLVRNQKMMMGGGADEFNLG